MKSRLFLIVMGLILVLFCYSFAQVPQMINYQGKLTTPAGAPVTDTLQIVFTIYADEAGTTPLWTETQPNVEILKGVFNVLLGSVNPISFSVFDGSTRYLGMQVGGDPEITPRKPMVSVAYAMRVGAGGGGSDNDWTYRITDTADTTLITGGAWGIARYGNMLYGNADSTHVNLGISSSTGANGQNYKYCTVAGGNSNAASGSSATVGGGSHNVASGMHSTIGGGDSDTASAYVATIAGGHGNTASGSVATIGGGESNHALSPYTFIGGGTGHYASASHATVGGGDNNASAGAFSTIGGGKKNYTMNLYGTIAGGLSNTAGGFAATIAGGDSNTANGDYATIAGGYRNTNSSWYGIIGGGLLNTVSGFESMIGGGFSNLVEGDYSAVLGGYANTITSTADYSYLFGINGILSQDSTFMVDMPHIRFGKETGGYEFPTQDGDTFQVLASMGNGALDWLSLPPASGWTDNGSVVRLISNTDSVGIGTATPTDKLQVDGNIKLNKNEGRLILRTSSHNDPGRCGILFDNNSLAPFLGDDTEDQYFDFYTTWSATRTYDTHLKVHGSATSNWGKYIELTHDGTDGKITTDAGHIILSPASNVGIGTSSPTAKLDVNGSTGYNQVRMRTSYTPTGTSDTNGNVGDIAWDNNYFYVKTNAGWKRAALSTW
jgi:hypothetical protein